MDHLLRPRIWPSFLASSGVGPCDVPFRYASGPIPRYRGTVARWHAHLRGLATAIHKISGLEQSPIIASIYLNGRTCDVAGPLGGEKNNQISEFFYLSQSPKWNAFFPCAYYGFRTFILLFRHHFGQFSYPVS